MIDQVEPAPLARPDWLDREMWPYSPKTFAHPDGRMCWIEQGVGEPLLLVHGTPSFSIDWRHTIAALSGSRRCIALDHLGFGLSDRPEGANYRPEDHAERFAAFADSLDLHDVVLVVHDFGGPIALPWAISHRDRLRGLVVVNTWAWPVDNIVMATGARFLGSPFGRWLYRRYNLSLRVIAPSAWGDRSKLTDALQSQLLAPFPDVDSRERVLWALARSLIASRDHFARIEADLAALRDVPTLLLWGMKDSAFRPYQIERWMRHIPKATLVRFDSAGHWPHEEEPAAFAAALGDWLSSLDT